MKTGLAIVGAGAVIQGRHLPALSRSPNLEVRVVYDPDPRASERVARAAGARVARSIQEAVTAPDVQAVTVASPTACHREAVEAAADAGKHVLCEKPIATTLRDARAMINAAARAGVVLQVGFHHRFTSEFRLVRRLLEAGVIGRVHAFQGLISEPLGLVPGGDNYRLDPRLSGGLTLNDFGQHRIDQIRGLLGDFSEVAAQFGNVDRSHGLDDNVALLVRTISGALGALSFHRFSQGAASPTMLIGEKGVLCFSAYVTNPFHAAPVAVFSREPLPEEVRAYSRPADWWSPPQPGWTALWPPVEDPYFLEYEAFQAALRDGRPPVASGEEGYRALEIALAAYHAWNSRRPVTLPLDPEKQISLPANL
jgi:UDP-N-acetylglucosamine 3-dehydrogenase